MTPRGCRCRRIRASSASGRSGTWSACERRSRPTTFELSTVAGSGTVLDVADAPTVATIGIGHTRWATHGGVTEENAHPHSDMGGNVHVVLNGIIENHVALRRELEERGVAFSSETDAEVVAHLLGEHCAEGRSLTEAVTLVRFQLEGHFAFVALSADEDGLMVATRRECPLVVGVGDGEHLLGVGERRLRQAMRRVQVVEEGEVVAVTASGARLLRPARTGADPRGRQCRRGGRALGDARLRDVHAEGDPRAARCRGGDLEGALAADGIVLPELGLDDLELRRLDRITIVGCGTSYHAGLLGRCAIRRVGGCARRLRHRFRVPLRRSGVGAGDLVIGITQSGETADTLAALRMARSRGADGCADERAGQSCDPRIRRIAPHAGRKRGGRGGHQDVHLSGGRPLPARAAAGGGAAVAVALGAGAPALGGGRAAAAAARGPRRHRRSDPARPRSGSLRRGFFLYMGRQAGLPVALEGALKLKEISYIPCDAYAAGEMKHGPIAMLFERTPVVCIATDSPVLGKLLSNIAEVRARGAHVIAIASAGAVEVAEHCEETVYVPECDRLIAPILAAVPLQLLAYHVAGRGG